MFCGIAFPLCFLCSLLFVPCRYWKPVHTAGPALSANGKTSSLNSDEGENSRGRRPDISVGHYGGRRPVSNPDPATRRYNDAASMLAPRESQLECSAPWESEWEGSIT